uniref:IP05627p n=1 Tax=Drosophila melanogaster TaxID=7227 RepID=C5WLT7_DROME|nr:IP05627p [Drosophila melanogaster]ACV82455.1 IP21889p [Drosophila melanogaster]
MDSRIGLDYIVENRDYIAKLGAALDTQNATVKKQVFELLSALCAYSPDGYARAIETLEFYKNLKKQRYRFKIVINELELSSAAAHPPLDYQAALLAFINCVIISAATLQERIRIRNEFIGLKVLPLLNNLRKVAQSVGDIIVQLDVFVEQQECDEAQSLQAPDGINLNSHLDVFYAILRQVADTPQEVPFLNILQHLLRIDPKEPLSDIIWDTTERLVHRATLLESHEDSVRLLRTPSSQKFACQSCRGSDASSPTRKSLIQKTTTFQLLNIFEHKKQGMTKILACTTQLKLRLSKKKKKKQKKMLKSYFQYLTYIVIGIIRLYDHIRKLFYRSALFTKCVVEETKTTITNL